MDTDISIALREDLLETDAIILEGPHYNETPLEEFDTYDNPGFVYIDVNRDTGAPLRIMVEGFTTDTEEAVKSLQEHPLPWTFSLPQMKLKEKPLDEILLAIWKKYRNIEMEGDD